MHKMRGMRKHGMTIALVTVVLLASWQPAFAVYKAVTPKTALAEGEVAITKLGCYAEEGKTYVLMNDISSPTSAIFLGKNVTLDLNGHTITYADGPYQHVPNYSFEEGLTGWDTSRAPGARTQACCTRFAAR